MAAILVIDDDPDVRALLQEHLVQAGHEVVSAADGRAGLTLLHQEWERLDLVMTDILMPEMDGIGVLRTLAEFYPEVRVVALSGGGLTMKASTGLHAALKLGAVQTLAKPFTREQLLGVVERALTTQPTAVLEGME